MFEGRHFALRPLVSGLRLSLRDLKEMMAERGISVDHSTIHRWVVHFSPRLLERFNRRKGAVTGKWHVDETYLKVQGKWMYLYRAIDSAGDTVEFWFSEHRDLPAAKRFFRKALERHGRPERVVIDGSQTNREAIVACDAHNRLRDRSRRAPNRIRIRQSRYLNNRIEQDHRRSVKLLPLRVLVPGRKFATEPLASPWHSSSQNWRSMRHCSAPPSWATSQHRLRPRRPASLLWRG